MCTGVLAHSSPSGSVLVPGVGQPLRLAHLEEGGGPLDLVGMVDGARASPDQPSPIRFAMISFMISFVPA